MRWVIKTCFTANRISKKDSILYAVVVPHHYSRVADVYSVRPVRECVLKA